MNLILFPTDCSEFSLNAFHHACNYAKITGAQIILLNIFSVPIYPDDNFGENFDTDTLTDPTEKINAFIDDYLQTKTALDLKDLFYSIRIIESNIAEGIINVSEQEHVQMIIMGTEKMHLLDSGKFGSITSEIIQKAGCPVLAIPGKTAFKIPERMLCAVDYKDDGKHLVNMTMNFSSLFEAEVTFLYVKPEEEEFNTVKFRENYAATQFYLSNYENWRIDTVIIENTLRETITHYIESHAFDILALETRSGRNWKEIYAAGSTREIALTANIPLLAFHAIK